MNLKLFLTSLALSAMAAHAADYDVVIENMPAGFSVQIAGQNFTANTPASSPAKLQGQSVKRDQIVATSHGGWIPTVSVDEANSQIAVSYQQLFEPATSVTAADAKAYYLYENGNAVYLKFVSPNLTANSFTGDRFVFVEDGAGSGKYFIYNKSAGHYVTYTGTADNKVNASQTSQSVVQWTDDASQAKSWKIVDDGEADFVDFVPGEVKNVTAATPGWNFRGGKNFMLNLYDRSDRNSRWSITGNIGSPVNCATQVFSLPGQPFMHKLIANEGDVITSVTGLPAGLEVDMDSRRYPFVHGTAPAAGDYHYTIHLNGGAQDEQTVDVAFTVSPDLNQPRPFMGLLTWNAFKDHIDQQTIMILADALETFGLKDLGYDHMCIDDCWAKHDREGGHYALNPDKFNDLTALCDYVHAKGMKIGIYSDAADRTCSGAMPGSYNHEDTDAQDFVKWGFDLLKYDYCHAPADAKTAETRYRAIYDALSRAQTAAGKRPEDFMLYMCEWGWRQPWLWGARTGATCWRATDDTRDFWSDTTYRGGVLQIINVMKHIWQYNGVNRWNDADMLVVGLRGTGYSSNDGGGDGYSPGLTTNEARTNFALWCMWSSPLTLSNNITNLDGKRNTLTGKTVTNAYYKQDLEIIRNRHLIALDQDPLGQAAEPIVDRADCIVFAKDLADGDVAVSITNLGSSTADIVLDLSLVPGLAAQQTYEMRDLWKDAEVVGTVVNTDSYTARVSKHNTAVYRLHAVDVDTDGVHCVQPSRSHHHSSYDLQGRSSRGQQYGIVVKDGKKMI